MLLQTNEPKYYTWREIFCILANQLIKSYYLLFDCLKACQSFSIGNIGFLTFSSIATKLHYTMIKNRY